MPEDLANMVELLGRMTVLLEEQHRLQPEGLSPADAAAFCGVSVAKWHQMNASGLCPAPVELGDRCPRWVRSELVAWLRAGAPARSRWRDMRESSLRKVAG